MLLSCLVRLLFFRAALFLCTRPLATALSTVLTASAYAFVASSRLPPATAASKRLRVVLSRVRFDLFLASRTLLVRLRFSADLMFGTFLSHLLRQCLAIRGKSFYHGALEIATPF